MPSRKRNKGRDRKAKKDAERMESEREIVRNVWLGLARGLNEKGRVITQCNHGALTIPKNNAHPVVSFMDTFFDNMLYKTMATSPNLYDTLQKHADVWNNVSQRKTAMNILLSIGTNQLLDDDFLGPMDLALYLSHAIAFLENYASSVVVLENYDGRDIESTMNCPVAETKVRDIFNSGSCVGRDVLKFYRKRTACSCLKKMHLEARKTQPKTGLCSHCNVVKRRALLMVCSRCRIEQYCSRECQVSDWSKHKCRCDMHVFAQKQQISRDAANTC